MTPRDLVNARNALTDGAPPALGHPERVPSSFEVPGFAAHVLTFDSHADARAYASAAGLVRAVEGRTVVVPAGTDAALLDIITAEVTTP